MTMGVMMYYGYPLVNTLRAPYCICLHSAKAFPASRFARNKPDDKKFNRAPISSELMQRRRPLRVSSHNSSLKEIHDPAQDAGFGSGGLRGCALGGGDAEGGVFLQAALFGARIDHAGGVVAPEAHDPRDEAFGFSGLARLAINHRADIGGWGRTGLGEQGGLTRAEITAGAAGDAGGC